MPCSAASWASGAVTLLGVQVSDGTSRRGGARFRVVLTPRRGPRRQRRRWVWTRDAWTHAGSGHQGQRDAGSRSVLGLEARVLDEFRGRGVDAVMLVGGVKAPGPATARSSWLARQFSRGASSIMVQCCAASLGVLTPRAPAPLSPDVTRSRLPHVTNGRAACVWWSSAWRERPTRKGQQSDECDGSGPARSPGPGRRLRRALGPEPARGPRQEAWEPASDAGQPLRHLHGAAAWSKWAAPPRTKKSLRRWRTCVGGAPQHGPGAGRRAPGTATATVSNSIRSLHPCPRPSPLRPSGRGRGTAAGASGQLLVSGGVEAVRALPLPPVLPLGQPPVMTCYVAVPAGLAARPMPVAAGVA